MLHSRYELVTSTRVDHIHGLDDHHNRGWLSPDGKIYYLRIPKNASSFMSGEFDSMGWSDISKDNHLRYESGICILRDPWKRWLSGITQFFHDQEISLERMSSCWDLLRQILYNQPFQDAHTAPQVAYLHGHDLERFQFVMMSEHSISVGERIYTLLSSRGYDNEMYKHDRQNVTSDDTNRSKIMGCLLDKIKEDDALITRVRDYYSSDYNLIDWVVKNKGWS